MEDPSAVLVMEMMEEMARVAVRSNVDGHSQDGLILLTHFTGRIGGCGGGDGRPNALFGCRPASKLTPAIDQITVLSSLSRRQKNILFRAILRAGLGALWPPPSPEKSSGSNSKSSSSGRRSTSCSSSRYRSRIGSWRSPVSCRRVNGNEKPPRVIIHTRYVGRYK